MGLTLQWDENPAEDAVDLYRVYSVDQAEPLLETRETTAEVPNGAGCYSVTAVNEEDSEIEKVLERADALLYEAKEQGRNRVLSD